MKKILVVMTWACLLACLPSCALLTKAPPIVPRYFEPDVGQSSDAQVEQSAADEDKRLRLGRIEAGPHLRERMVYRASETEVGYYEDRRWTERPAAYVRRALSYSLFEQHGITRVVSGEAPNLDAELVAFEELQGDEHRVRVQIVVTLDDSAGGAIDQTVTVEEPVAKGGDENDVAPVVHAFSTALSRAVEQISQMVLKQLELVSVAQPRVAPAPGTTSTTVTTTSVPSQEP